MKTALFKLTGETFEKHEMSNGHDLSDADFVLCFAGKETLEIEKPYHKIRAKFPNAQIISCSTSGEIYHDQVLDDTVVVTAVKMEKTKLKSSLKDIRDYEDSYSAAVSLYQDLKGDDLAYIMVFSDGAMVNGSQLAMGLSSNNKQLLITGGLAGDADRFQETLVGLNDFPSTGKIVGLGFYGNEFMVSHGSQGGWDVFGLEKSITKSDQNVLYEIDGESALNLYKKYLGKAIEQLPGSALLFPLSVTYPGENQSVVRTILSIDEEENSMTFAGDVPQGATIRFMRAHFDRLNNAAATAAEISAKNGLPKDSLALLVSCVGRKLILGPRVDEEIEAVRETLGSNVVMTGMYSYGEISPFNEGGACQLHNQTMTITTFYEL